MAAAAIPALVAAGCHVRSKDIDGDQPLHSAVQYNTDSQAAAAAAAALITAGADPQAPSGEGRQPIALAREREDAAECADLLRVLEVAAAAIRRECPVCLELGACWTGPCGHLVCEDCAEKDQVCVL